MPLLRIGSKLLHFVHIPKTGGASIEHFALKIGKVGHFSTGKGALPCSAQHMHAALYQALHIERMADWSFAIVRDPLKRLLSEYNMLVERRANPNVATVVDTRELRPGHEADFDAWVQHVFKRYARDPYVCDNHIRPQVEFLTPQTRIYRFEKGLEQVTQRIAFFCEIADAPEVPHKHKSESRQVTASRETVRRIVEFYDRDYRELRYPYPADDALEAADGAPAPVRSGVLQTLSRLVRKPA